MTPFWVSFWRCFGSPNGGQGHQNAPSKKHQTMMSKMTPNWSQRGSQNGTKIIKNEVLEALCFKGGSQEASRIDFGEVLGPFWDHVRQFFEYNFAISAGFLEQHVANKNVQNHKETLKNVTESFQETASLFVPSCIEKFTSKC